MREYIKATNKDTEVIYDIVQSSIMSVYPKYYPKEIVDFFCKLHCLKLIAKDIEDGFVGMLLVDDICVGTGCYRDNHITRVYVKPNYQNKGYGSYIMDCLEHEIAKKHPIAFLDASLPAGPLYEKRGYTTVRHGKFPIENGMVLVYEVMEKTLIRNSSKDAFYILFK